MRSAFRNRSGKVPETAAYCEQALRICRRDASTIAQKLLYALVLAATEVLLLLRLFSGPPEGKARCSGLLSSLEKPISLPEFSESGRAGRKVPDALLTRQQSATHIAIAKIRHVFFTAQR